jgi:TolA-binding protein
MRAPWLAAPVMLALALALTGPSPLRAAPAAEDPRDLRLKELSERVADLEKALQGVNAQLEAATRAADLARGDLKGLQDRVTGLEAGRGPTPAAAAPQAAANPAPAQATPATPTTPAEDGLTRGRKQLQSGDAPGAEATLTAWLAASPKDPKAGEGAYLRGRARGQQSAWADAAADYITALKGWPSTWWAPDAVVELARALGRIGKTTESCQALGELATRYPTAPEGTRTRAAAVAAQSQCGT